MLSIDIPLASQNQFAWMQSGELHMTVGKNSTASVPLDTRYRSHFKSIFVENKIHRIFYSRNHKEANQDEIEVMSTDTSSSSSSDSQ